MKGPTIDERTWYWEGKASAFLVHAPITFGHSQLKVTGNFEKEEDAFLEAAEHIAKCIAKFRTVLSACNLDEWAPLANYTETSGSYVKTLVLRARANEEVRHEYKVHLVPCFTSYNRSG